MTRSRAVVGRARQIKASTARTCTTTGNSEQPDGAGQRKTATDPLTVPGGWRFRTSTHSREQAQMTRTRLLEGPTRQTKAHTARTCFLLIRLSEKAKQRRAARGMRAEGDPDAWWRYLPDDLDDDANAGAVAGGPRAQEQPEKPVYTECLVWLGLRFCFEMNEFRLFSARWC